MPIQNADVAAIFSRIANLLEIEEANPFRVRAYRNAARTISSLSRNIADMVAAGEDLSILSGIGRDLAEKIGEIVRTGSLKQLEKLEKRVPAALNAVMDIPGLGPKRVAALHQQLGITSRSELKAAAEKQQIRGLDGFGPKTEQSILEALQQPEAQRQRILLKEAEQRAEPLLAYLRGGKGIKKMAVAGSYRRRKETVGDLDILVSCKKDARVMERFTSYEDVRKVVSSGDTRSTVLLKSGLQVDLRVLPAVGYGAGLHYFTGSKAHNIAVRKRGIQRGYKINEYGVFKNGKRVAGKTESEVYQKVGLTYIPPELREDGGEIAAAENDALPRLISLEDIRGDLHCHTTDSDGRASIREMARAACDRGYDYLAITDHSRKVRMANGLDAERLADQIERIERLDEELEDIRLLKGIEVDILEDGRLDLPDDILKELDLRVCSVHYHQNLSRKKQTRRILKAMENPYFNILGHPTGRLIGRRKPMEVDMQQIVRAAGENGCILELNAEPERLDLNDHYCRMAAENDVKIAISTDAHSSDSLDFMRFGIGQARRGWLQAEKVINTRRCPQMLECIQRS